MEQEFAQTDKSIPDQIKEFPGKLLQEISPPLSVRLGISLIQNLGMGYSLQSGRDVLTSALDWHLFIF